MGLFGGSSKRSTKNTTITKNTEQGAQQGDNGQATIVSGSNNQFVDGGAFKSVDNAINKVTEATRGLFSQQTEASREQLKSIGATFDSALLASQGKQQFNIREMYPFGLALGAIYLLMKV